MSIREVELLYFGHGHASGTVLHRHPYYQLEYCIAGQLPGADAETPITLNAGDYWLIPPRKRHRFLKAGDGLDYISVKFVASGAFAGGTGHDPVCRYFLDRIRSVMDGETVFNAYSADGKCIIENCLAGFIARLDRLAGPAPKSNFETRLQVCVFDSGAAANVDYLAEKSGMTRAEFKYRFRQEIGHGRIKEYIDSVLLEMIERHLRYSGVSLNGIAEQLNFSSIYAFSRYFRHHRGMPPSEFRRRNREFRE
ncbi:MAG: helix-turn-helix transcriptional regulator [Lentisphaeria bacterium]|nr:helix-turn-helix transcriptional regulator [Lentisphaeria bacterium]